MEFDIYTVNYLLMKLVVPILFALNSVLLGSSSDFLSEQKQYHRVRDAINEKEQVVSEILKAKGLTIDNVNILLVAFKAESKLVIFAKRSNDDKYLNIKEYHVCHASGTLGPKRIQGDLQVPEGFYHIDRFNPTSLFHLSLGINYPNRSDRRKSNSSNLGGDIFIHGSCRSAGCIAVTDDKIKEIYLLAVYSRSCGQEKIPVYIFPFEMTDCNFSEYKKIYNSSQELIDFWENLRKGYDIFHGQFEELKLSVSSNGDYVYQR